MNSNISSPMMICKSAYIKSSTHYINTLEYSGNTIDKQILVYTDGSTMEYSGKDKIVLSLAEESMIENIHMMFKDGGSKTLSYSNYKNLINNSKSAIKVNELIGVSDESQFVLSNHSELEDIDFLNLTDKSYHELKDLDFEKYISYTAERKGVVKSIDGHGLFGINGDIDIEVAKMKALEHEKSRKWVHIISLPEGEDVRTGFDKREMWQALISAEAPRIAKLYNISLENLVMNCAFHGNTENAHVHLQFYSTNSSEGYIKGGTEAMSKASERLKSIFANNIFKDDISSLNATKDVVCSELKSSLNAHLKNIKQSPSFNKEISSKFLELADYLNGKPSDSYAYLKASDKSKVDDILKCIVTSDPSMKFLYEQYVNIQKEYIKNYTIDPSKIEKRLENFEIRFFSPKRKEDTDRAYHNTILKAVYDFNRISSSKTMRTVEREISDFTPNEDALSSLLSSEAPPEDTVSFSSEYHKANLVRTVEEKISDFSLANSSLSSAKTKQSQVDSVPIENSEHKEYYSKNKEPLSDVNYRNALVMKSVGRIMKLIATSLHSHANYLHQENERKNKLEFALRSKKQFKTKKFDRSGFTPDNENQVSY